MRTNSARRSEVSQPSFFDRTLIKKVFEWLRPSLLGITVYKDVMSMVKMILLSPEKLRNISLAFCEKTCLTGPLQYKIPRDICTRFGRYLYSTK